MTHKELIDLLVDARDSVNHSAQAWLAEGYDDNAADDYQLRDRIDAAIEAPATECPRCEVLRDVAAKATEEQGLAYRRMMEAQQQRDEARAEVRRLNAEVKRLKAEVGWCG
jgi:hypothetical protein